MNAGRLLLSLRLLIQSEAASLAFLGTYEYTVQAVSGSTMALVPVDTSLTLPAMTSVPLRSSTMGESLAEMVVGQPCRVQFLDGNPAKPVVVSLSAISGTVTIDASDSVTLGSSDTQAVAIAGGNAPAARQTDMVNLIIPAPAPPPQITGLVNGQGFTGTITGLPPGAAGIITGGNEALQW
jgi:hypothetical protein